jgi:coenzyme F420-0:L-glutamate ligase/coenzyme F420-1:gamma-L-glutamate ligase
MVDLLKIQPSAFAKTVARQINRNPEHVEVILRESSGIVRMKDNHLITETKHGYVCANAGVDKSNVTGKHRVSLLPEDPDGSAERIRRRIEGLSKVKVAVVISDTFGRAWRIGHVNFAIGVAGMKPVRDYRGQRDMFGYKLRVTAMAVVDELAAAAELVMNKSDGIPVVIIKGYSYPRGKGSAKELVRPIQEDLFR